jgi:polygalacturonase
MLDLDGCRRVTVSDCLGDTDDDGITLKSTGPAACQDIVIQNCVISSHCNAIKCGTESTGGFRNISISNCTISPSRAPKVISGRLAGISGISLEIVDGGTLDGVTISNVVMQGTAAPLFIRLGNRARKHKVDAEVPPMGTLRNVNIMNLVARDAGAVGCSISGIPGHFVENIALSGVRIERAEAGNDVDRTKIPAEREEAYPEATMFGRLPVYGFYLRHAKNVRFSDVVVTPHADDRRPAFASVDAHNVQVFQSSFSAEREL